METTEEENINNAFQKGKLEQKKEELKLLIEIRKILNKYHSQIALVEIGRQNVLNDIDNEISLDNIIKQLTKEIKGVGE